MSVGSHMVRSGSVRTCAREAGGRGMGSGGGMGSGRIRPSVRPSYHDHDIMIIISS